MQQKYGFGDKNTKKNRCRKSDKIFIKYEQIFTKLSINVENKLFKKPKNLNSNLKNKILLPFLSKKQKKR